MWAETTKEERCGGEREWQGHWRKGQRRGAVRARVVCGEGLGIGCGQQRKKRVAENIKGCWRPVRGAIYAETEMAGVRGMGAARWGSGEAGSSAAMPMASRRAQRD